ncbi:MAG: Stp1/IreP family PP2C-type Ser/Thr phosphatase [Lachnospiraceae bacterium]
MKAYAVTDTGIKRTMNQDAFLCSEEPIGLLPNCFIVADGMGGHNAGDIASRTVVDSFVTHMRTSSQRTPIQAIEESIKQSNEELIAKAMNMKELEGMGTTFVLASIDEDNNLLVANIGDSRLYLIDDDSVKQITRDHSLVAEMVRNGEIKKEEARFHPQKNVVLRAISTRNVVSPDFYRVRVKPGNYCLLCSDGLSDMLDESEMLKVVNEYEEVSDIAEKMIVLANENGGKDNITLILIKI